MDLSHRGRRAAALKGAENVLLLGRSLEGAGGATTLYLVGVRVKSLGLNCVRVLGAGSRDDVEFLKTCADLAGRFRPDEEALGDAFRVEYQAWGHQLDDLAAGRQTLSGVGGTPLATWDWLWDRFSCIWHLKVNQTKALLAERTRTCIRDARRPYLEMESRERAPVADESWNPIVPSNLTGKRLAVVATGGHARMLVQKCYLALGAESLRVRLAACAFTCANGRLPERLDELVPGYLKAVPPDPFDGKPLRYNPVKGVIYSVGLDLQDDGGMTEKEIEAFRNSDDFGGLLRASGPPSQDLPDPSWPIEF
jgi:hypothetical protein